VEWRNQDGKKKKKERGECVVVVVGGATCGDSASKSYIHSEEGDRRCLFFLLLLFVVLLFIHPFDAFHPAFVLLYFRAPSSLFLASFSLRGSATAYISSYFICLSSFIIN
jgi:hypothetical protein